MKILLNELLALLDAIACLSMTKIHLASLRTLNAYTVELHNFAQELMKKKASEASLSKTESFVLNYSLASVTLCIRSIIFGRDLGKSLRMNKAKFSGPPMIWKYSLYLFMPRKWRDNCMGDLEEDYLTVYDEFGARKANLFYIAQVLRTIGSVWLGWVLKWGTVAAIGEAFKRFIP